MKCAQPAINSGVTRLPADSREIHIAGYKHSNIRHPAPAGTAPCSPPHAQRKRILMRAGKRVQSLSSTTRATLSAPFSTKRLPNTLRPGTRSPAQANSTARATSTRQSPMSARPFANIWNAASSPMALPGRGVTIAVTTISSPIPAKAGGCAPRATHGAWWRRRPTSRITSSRACQCASGCCLFRSGYATS